MQPYRKSTTLPLKTLYRPCTNRVRDEVGRLAAFTLTDWAIIAALKEAGPRGVAIRIVLEPSQRHAYDKLAEMIDVVRVKKRGRPYMHLKAYVIAIFGRRWGGLLRTTPP